MQWQSMCRHIYGMWCASPKCTWAFLLPPSLLPAIQCDTPSRWSLQWMPCTYVPRSSTKKRFSVPCMHAVWLASSFQFCTDTEAQCTFSVDYRVPYTILVETGRQGSHCTQTTSDACMHGFISSMNWERRMRFIYYLRLLEWVTEWMSDRVSVCTSILLSMMYIRRQSAHVRCTTKALSSYTNETGHGMNKNSGCKAYILRTPSV